MNGKNTHPRESLHEVSENALLFEKFFIFVDDFYTDLESDYPNSSTLSHDEEELLEYIVELGIEMQVFDIEMRNHDFTHYKTIFIILRQLFENGFYEDTPEIQNHVFKILQKYTELCKSDTSSLITLQKKYHSKLESALFSDENDFLELYGEQEIEFFLSIIRSEEEMKKQKKRLQTFLSAILGKDIINTQECSDFWNIEDIDGYYNLFFLLLEKDSLWEDNSDLKQTIGSELRKYFFGKNDEKYEALNEYDQGFEYDLHLRSEDILHILVEKKISTSAEIVDAFLLFLFENKILSNEEYKSYIISENMISTLCDIMTKIILGKYLNEYPKLEVKWITFLIAYYNTLGSQKDINQLHKYAKYYDYSISQIQDPVLKLEDFVASSDAFHHFLNVAMDLPNRIKNLETRDFFEGEQEVLKVLERFRDISYINKDEFYEFQEKSFEIGIYKLLKKLYLKGFFSGDINHVETIKDTLISIATLISPDDIGEINTYFKTRYDKLILKEQKNHIVPFARHVGEILQEGTEQQEADLIWDFMNILSKYDRSGNITKLSGYGNSPRLVGFECLHFALTQHLLGKDVEMIQTLYYQVLRYYRENNFSKRLKELENFSQYAQEQGYNFRTQDMHEIMIGVRYLLAMIERGIYNTKQIELIEKLVHTLFSQSYISEKEQDTILSNKNSPTGFFHLYTILINKGFLEKNKKIEVRIQEIKNVTTDILAEKENPSPEDIDLFGYTPELRGEMVRSNTLQLIEWIKHSKVGKLHNEFFEEFLSFLGTILSGDSTYLEYFGEELQDIIHIEDKVARAHELLLFIYCDFLDDDYDTMEQVYFCLKEYYFQNKALCEIIDRIIYPHRISNQSN